MIFLTNRLRRDSDPKVLRSGPSLVPYADRLARKLGWFSIGLGLVEMLAPHRVTRALGLRGHESTVRAFGAREVASGMLSLSVEKQAGLWSRVAGDALDLGLLRRGLHPFNPKRDNVRIAILAVAGIAVVDLLAAMAIAKRHARGGRSAEVDYSDRSGFPQGIEAARRVAKSEPGRASAAVAVPAT